MGHRSLRDDCQKMRTPITLVTVFAGPGMRIISLIIKFRHDIYHGNLIVSVKRETAWYNAHERPNIDKTG